MSAIDDRFLDVGSQQREPQNAGGVAGTGGPFLCSNFRDALELALSHSEVPMMCANQSIELRDVRFRVTVRNHWLVGKRMGLRPEWHLSWVCRLPH